MRHFLLALALLFSLQGCFFVAGAAAGAAGVAVVYDHRKLEQIAEDQKIANTISEKIQKNPDYTEGSHIDVTCFNNMVLLTGQTLTMDLRTQAEEIARETSKVKRVYNEISVKGPTSPLTRTSDTWITTKIKTQMLATKDLKSSTIKVITENGSVYLMGIVTRQQADMSVKIARQVSGVQRVMKIFQYKD